MQSKVAEIQRDSKAVRRFGLDMRAGNVRGGKRVHVRVTIGTTGALAANEVAALCSKMPSESLCATGAIPFRLIVG